MARAEQLYLPRIIDGQLERALKIAGAVVIEGPRACGKTMTALHASASHIFLDSDEARETAEIAPSALLDGESPRLLDEWQLAPELWNKVRRAVDASAEAGRFILTGSSVPKDDVTRHTGAGRFLRLRQRTMSLQERSRCHPTISLMELFDGDHVATNHERKTITEVIDNVTATGFPGLIHLSFSDAAVLLRSYLRDVSSVDIPSISGIRHEPAVIDSLIRALARSTGSDVNFTTLAADVQQVAPNITASTVSNYVTLLERIFLLEKQPPWTPKLRSRARLRQAPKVHFCDPALAAVALRATPTSLMKELSTFGLLFESLVFRELAIMADAIGAELFHYRDSNGHEIDAVLVLEDGRWGAVEVKVGQNQIAAASKSLDKAVEQIDINDVGEPSFKLVLTGTGSTFTLENGTLTCPITALTL